MGTLETQKMIRHLSLLSSYATGVLTCQRQQMLLGSRSCWQVKLNLKARFNSSIQHRKTDGERVWFGPGKRVEMQKRLSSFRRKLKAAERLEISGKIKMPEGKHDSVAENFLVAVWSQIWSHFSFCTNENLFGSEIFNLFNFSLF